MSHQWIARGCALACLALAQGAVAEPDMPKNVPELMVTKAGAPVKDVATWEKARQEGMVSYHYRPGIHNLTLHDWNRYMNFADRLGWRASSRRARRSSPRARAVK